MFKEFYNKKVLITGHTGFKGSWLTLWMLKCGAEVYGISDKIPTNPSMFENLDLARKINHRFIDIRDYQPLEDAILEIQPDFVFHLAAQPIVSLSYSDPLTTLSSNIMGTAHVLEALKKLEKDCVAVMITSDKCYENLEQVWGYREIDQIGGKDIYSCSKGASELVIHSYHYSFFKDKKTNTRLASARAGNVIGGGDFSTDRIVPDCMKAWSKEERVVIRSPYATRPWQHVLEPLSAYMLLAVKLVHEPEQSGESYNFGPNNERSETVLHLIDGLSKHWGFEDSSKAYEYVKRTDFKEAGLLKLNCDKALFNLNWKANLDYEQTLDFVSSWYFNFYNCHPDMFQFTMDQISRFESIASY